ncbi:MAG: methylmalonyl Co-A mutase-associated GTPase MeaB [Bacteroidota bacterium]
MSDPDSALSEHRAEGAVSPMNPNLKRHVQSTQQFDTEDYLRGLREGNRMMLSRAITLIESTRPDDQKQARTVLDACASARTNSIRIGITGIPGVGQSTFIEALGLHLAEAGKQVAVCTVDPSSERSRGSILGDKTRMPKLATHENAFIRPSPTGGSLGGVARTTRETILLCEAAGFTHVLVETVGVGQSETAVHAMVDCFLLLALAHTGDELQGIKRGIMEMADAIVINKADAHADTVVQQTRQTLRQALQLLPERTSGWTPPVLTCSALKQNGITDVWQAVRDCIDYLRKTDAFQKRRAQQARHWLRATIDHALQQDFYANDRVQQALPDLEEDVASGTQSAYTAAQRLLELYRSPKDEA